MASLLLFLSLKKKKNHLSTILDRFLFTVLTAVSQVTNIARS